jgi:hypothetical protein
VIRTFLGVLWVGPFCLNEGGGVPVLKNSGADPDIFKKFSVVGLTFLKKSR